MHDLIKDMGREIVRQEAPSKPGKRSRLFDPEDVLRVLTKNSGSSNIEGIMLDNFKEEVEWRSTTFKKMKNLRILIIEDGVRFSVGPNYLPNSLRVLNWVNYPSESLPFGFSARKLVVLSLPHSCVRLEKPLQKLMHLVEINLSDCKFLTHVPDMCGVPSLKKLILKGCENLMEIHESVGFLKHLTDLNARNCVNLTSFLPRMWFPSLQFLWLDGCKKLEHFPDIVGEMKKLVSLGLPYTGIEELPQSMVNLARTYSLAMEFHVSLREISAQVGESITRFKSIRSPQTIGTPSLGSLTLRGCGLSDEDLEVILKCSPNLSFLTVPENHFVPIPACVKESVRLTELDVSECFKLQEIPELPWSTYKVHAGCCPYLTSESKSRLWSKALQKEIMPYIRQWAPDPNGGRSIQFKFYVNGRSVFHLITSFLAYPIADDDVLLCAIEVLNLGEHLNHIDNWTYVEISCQVPGFATSECGVYVCKKQTNMDDIQFSQQLKIVDESSSLAQASDVMDLGPLASKLEEKEEGPSITSSVDDLEK